MGISKVLLGGSLLLVFLAASRITGSYFYLLASYLLFLLYVARPGLIRYLSGLDLRFFSSLTYLILYQLFVLLGDLALIGFSFKLRAALMMSLAIPLGFTVGAIVSTRETAFPRWHYVRTSLSGSFLFVLLAATGGILSSLYSAWLLKSSGDLSIVALRPSETLYSIGLFLIALIIAQFVDQVSEVAPLRRPVVLILIFLSVALIPFSFFVFRGVVSSVAAATVCWPLIIILLRSILHSRRFSLLDLSLFAAMAAFLAYLLSFFFSLKEFLFRYLIFPFYASNSLNGRVVLYVQALPFLASSNLVGEASGLSAFQPQWTHLFFLDTILRHGYVACFFVLAFLLQIAVLLVRSKSSLFLRIHCAFVFFSLFIASLVQPVEFSDGIAFQLSFLVLGLLYGLICPSGSNGFKANNP